MAFLGKSIKNWIFLLKHSKDLPTLDARKAANSVEFILKFLSYRVLTQNKVSYDRAKSMFQCEDSDDSVLQSILQVRHHGTENVFLYSKDTVLKNKAMTLKIPLFEFSTPTPL